LAEPEKMGQVDGGAVETSVPHLLEKAPLGDVSLI
jgi:hypothetical protein